MLSKTLLLVTLVVVCVSVGAAPDCPTVSVTCPSDRDALQFTATVSPDKPEIKLTYKWTVSRGEIKSGQGTPTITVEAERNGKGIGATVEVGGLPNNCPNQASCYITHL